MADVCFNVGKGRGVQFYDNVNANSPANSALVIMVLATSGLVSDATLIDYDTFDAILAGASNEVTNSGYARKVLTDADLSDWAPDDTNNRVDIDLPDQTFTAVAAGDGWSKVVIGYDADTTGGSDANIIPIAAYDVSITPDGNDIEIRFNAAGFLRAS